jgi:hypothetical protein
MPAWLGLTAEKPQGPGLGNRFTGPLGASREHTPGLGRLAINPEDPVAKLCLKPGKMNEDENAVTVQEAPSPAVPPSGHRQHEAALAAKPGSRKRDKHKHRSATALAMVMSQRLAEPAFEININNLEHNMSVMTKKDQSQMRKRSPREACGSVWTHEESLRCL